MRNEQCSLDTFALSEMTKVYELLLSNAWNMKFLKRQTV